jgi:hypothetical protein
MLGLTIEPHVCFPRTPLDCIAIAIAPAIEGKILHPYKKSQLGCSVPIACRFGAVRARAARLGGSLSPQIAKLKSAAALVDAASG